MFANVYGQDHIIIPVRRAIRNRRLANTILLSGEAGYGLFQLGLSIATYLFCKEPGDDACGQCANCRKISDLQHPDLHLFFPTATADETCASRMTAFRSFAKEHRNIDFTDWLRNMGMEGKSLNINKKIVNEILSSFAFKSYEKGLRVYLIWGAEYLGNQGNKLLKVIEEPPEGCFIILMTSNRQAILPTIHSRCQTHMLKPLSIGDLMNCLDIEETEENIRLMQSSRGDARRLELALKSSDMDHHLLWITFLRTAYKGNPLELLNKATEIGNRDKEFVRQFLLYGMNLISQMLNLKVGIPVETDIAVEKLAQLLRREDLETINNRLQTDFRNLNRNAHSKLLFTSLAIWLSELFRKNKNSSVRA